MNFDQADWIIIILLTILGVSAIIVFTVVGKTLAHDAKEKKAKSARLAADRLVGEEKAIPHEPQTQTKAKPAPPSKAADLASKESDAENDLVAAAEVYLTYELKEQAIISLEKHLLTNPNDKKALDLLKKAEASG